MKLDRITGHFNGKFWRPREPATGPLPVLFIARRRLARQQNGAAIGDADSLTVRERLRNLGPTSDFRPSLRDSEHFPSFLYPQQ